jgi:hypothetical protein
MKVRFPLLGLVVASGLVAVPVAAEEQSIGDSASQITLKMQVAVGQLKKLNTGAPTQTTQKQIVESLDDLITLLEKECEGCKNAGLNARKPANASIIRKGPGGMGDLHAARKDGKDWGELPPHERDRILQSMTEGFPSHYQRILERYYKRLAQEKPATAEAEAEEPAAKQQPTTEPKSEPAPAERPAAGN